MSPKRRKPNKSMFEGPGLRGLFFLFRVRTTQKREKNKAFSGPGRLGLFFFLEKQAIFSRVGSVGFSFWFSVVPKKDEKKNKPLRPGPEKIGIFASVLGDTFLLSKRRKSPQTPA